MKKQKDQLQYKTGPQYVAPKYTAQATLQYKTFLKRTMSEALQNSFSMYADPVLSDCKIGVDYTLDRADFPSIVVKFYEKSLKNAGVGHAEWGRADELERLKANVSLVKGSQEIHGLATTSVLFPSATEVTGPFPKGTTVERILGPTSILVTHPSEATAQQDITFSYVKSEEWIEYHHYLYEGDISLEIYGLSSVDRDKVADAIVETVAMGRVGPEGQTFLERIYEGGVFNPEFPYSKWHFIAVNTDILQGFGEQHIIAPWIPEDTWLYMTEYRFGVFGEFYSLTPEAKEGLLELLSRVDFYPWNSADELDTPPEDFPDEEIPEEKYIKVHAPKERELPPKLQQQEGTLELAVSLVPVLIP